MSNKILILALPVVFIVIAITACFERSIKIEMKNQTSPPDEVVIITDKTEYAQGEQVRVSVDYDGDLYIWDYPWTIQRKVGPLWIDLKLGLTPCLTDCKDVPLDKIIDCGFCQLEPPAWILRKGSTITFTWDQRYISHEGRYQCREYFTGKIISSKCMHYNQVPPGQYKIKLEYALNVKDKNIRKGVDIRYTEKEFIISKS